MKERCILLVEDDVDSRQLYAECFRMESYEPIEASTGDEALQALAGGLKPHLIMTDLSVPGISIEEFITRARKLAGNSAIPILVVSGRDDIAEKARTLGATAYLKKPCDLDRLLSTVARLAGTA